MARTKKPKLKLGQRVRAWDLLKHTGRITFGPRLDTFDDGTSVYAWKVTFDNDNYGQKWVSESSLVKLGRAPAAGRVSRGRAHLKPGHAYRLQGSQDYPASMMAWRGPQDLNWETVTHAGNAHAKFIGTRMLDGMLCNVFETPVGIYAQPVGSSGGKRRHAGKGVKVASHKRAAKPKPGKRSKVTSHARRWPDVLPDAKPAAKAKKRKARKPAKRATPANRPSKLGKLVADINRLTK